MSTRRLIVGGCLWLGVAAAGCSSGDESTAVAFQELSSCLRFERPDWIHSPRFGLTFDSSTELDEFYRKHGGVPPVVDFSRYTVAAYFAEPAACATLELAPGYPRREYQFLASTIQVRMIRKTYSGTCPASRVYPQVVVALERSFELVEFSIESGGVVPGSPARVPCS